VSCDAADKHVLTLMLDPRVVVLVASDQANQVDSLRHAALESLFRKVCVVGHLAHRGEMFKVAEFVTASPSIMPQEDRPPADWDLAGLFTACDKSVTPPRVTREERPNYPRDAIAAKVQGAVWVQAVVTREGKPDDLRVVRSLDTVSGLDRAAIDAAKRWRFKPATRDGQPVPSLVVLELTFTLK
jgi:protein TonB